MNPGFVSRAGGARASVRAAAVLLGAVLVFTGPAEAQQWRRLEQVLTSQQDYTVNSSGQAVGNPYHDLILTVTYTQQSTGKQFRRYGFWDGGRTFKIRGAFPAGTWSWSTTCSGTTAGKSCVGDTGLTTSGTMIVSALIVTPSCTPGPCYNPYELYNRGFPAVSADGRFLTYSGGTTPFFWSADTAWLAPVLATSANWQTYVVDRLNKGFTAVLIALAPDWAWTNPVAFMNQPMGCSSADPVPNNCSMFLSSYWQAFDDKVQQANQSGLVAVIAGLNDPMDRGGSKDASTLKLYPRKADIQVFARNLAARMAGNFVIYSGAFDDRKAAVNPDSGEVQEDVMKAALAALFPSQPANEFTPARQLKSIHLAGGATYSDYAAFQSAVDVHLFHSGHGNNGCLSGESAAVCALRRAREMALTLGNYSSGAAPEFATLRPNGNVETLYESDNADGTVIDCIVNGNPASCVPQEPDTPNRVRQAGHLTSLSGAFGSTTGAGHTSPPWTAVEGIFPWVFGPAPNDLASYLATPGTTYMQNLRALFASRPWKDLRPQHCNPPTTTCGNLITGNDTAPGDQKEVIAVTTNWRYAIAYMPNNSGLTINTASFPSFSTRWTKTWWNPRVGTVFEPASSSCSGAICSFIRPLPVPCSTDSGAAGNCDWVLLLEDTCPTCASATSSPAASNLRVGLGRQDGGTQPGIVAQLEAPDQSPLGPVAPVSTDPTVLHKLPQVARERGGSFLVVWQSENLDGSLWGVYARRYNPAGLPLGEPFPVNTETENDQTDPAVAETAGEFVIAWTSFGQDGDLGGIFAQRIRASGDPVGPEFPVNTTTTGHQGFPQVAASASGDFVVAWESGEDGSRSEVIYAQRFDRFGNRIGGEIRIDVPIDTFSELVTLAVEPLGAWIVETQRYDALGADLGRFAQRFSSAGEELGAAVEELAPAPR
jgi:hypothetical protein